MSIIGMDKDDRPTAMLISTYPMAFGAYKAIYEKGLKVPDDFSMIVFSGIHLSNWLYPEITTIDQYPYNAGKQVSKILIDIKRGKNIEHRRLLLTPFMNIKGSCTRIDQM